MTSHDDSGRDADDLCPDIASKAHTSTFLGESDTRPSICVIGTVADALETDPNNIGPLYEVIDPDALDMLFESPHKFKHGCVRFQFEGCTVTVDADGWVAVSPGTDDRK
ncbi:HalOD1 output domain-containing protein [Halorubrum sp. N11]|uniref:HalOD1 output domain-containing protein n=1 Tax=Halorubrum sp. N11 TaxID=3402276 RepID=UPI003EBEA757